MINNCCCKKIGFILVLYSVIFFSSCRKSTSPAPSPISANPGLSLTTLLYPKTTSINNLIGGYYIGLPSNYDQVIEKYPLLLYFPGAGQFGNGSVDLPLLLNDGPAELIDEKKFPGSFHVNNRYYSLIVLMPQCKNFPGTADVRDCIEFAKKTYRIDTSRIYLSGLSIGSIVSCDLAAEMPDKIAALVPMAGVCSAYANTGKCQQMAASNLPVWAFHSLDDPTISVNTTKEFIARLASFHPAVAPKMTLWANGGHDAWTRALHPDYRENGLNIYEWMLQYHR